LKLVAQHHVQSGGGSSRPFELDVRSRNRAELCMFWWVGWCPSARFVAGEPEERDRTETPCLPELSESETSGRKFFG